MLKHRLLSGFSLALIIISVVLWAHWMVLLAMLWVMMILAQREFIVLVTPASLSRSFKWLAQALGLLLLAGLFAETRSSGTTQLSVWVLLGSFWVLLLASLFSKSDLEPHVLGGLLLSLVYVTLCMGLMTHVVWSDAGTPLEPWPHPTLAARARILFMLWVVKMSDVGAYAFGMTLGRHRLCPRLSPGKSWEGFFGGLLVGMLASLFAVWLGSFQGVLTFGYRHALLIGLLLSLVGVAGDLSESMFKRAAAVKDSGQGFPGMGGILDMVDSLLPAGPVMMLYMTLTGVS